MAALHVERQEETLQVIAGYRGSSPHCMFPQERLLVQVIFPPVLALIKSMASVAPWWPTSKEKYAPPMNEIPKAVFSRRGVRSPDKKLTTMSLKGARAENTNQPRGKPSARVLESWLRPQIYTGELATEIKRLKRGSGKPLLAHGGAGSARSLVGTGLIDDYMLLVHPVVLGRGLPIFPDLARPLDLALIECIPFKSGEVMQIYRPQMKWK